MEHSNADLAALIGSRICHDLISPIGAINNGLELLDMTGMAGGPELDLIADSVDHAGARIRFFRIAYGAAGDQMLGAPEVSAVLNDLSQGARTRFRWMPETPQQRGDVRLAFLALQCVETALPHGGEGVVEVENGIWQVRGTGDVVAAAPDLWQGLMQNGADVNPATVQFALLPELMRAAGRQLQAQWDAHEVVIRF